MWLHLEHKVLTAPLLPSHPGLTSSPAFVELQTDLQDVTSVQDKNYPFRDFQTFAMRFLFPSASDDHIVLKPVQVARAPSSLYTITGSYDQHDHNDHVIIWSHDHMIVWSYIVMRIHNFDMSSNLPPTHLKYAVPGRFGKWTSPKAVTNLQVPYSGQEVFADHDTHDGGPTGSLHTPGQVKGFGIEVGVGLWVGVLYTIHSS